MKNITTVTEKRFGEYCEDDVSVTIRSSGATEGGGWRSVSHLIYSETVGALCTDDYKGPNRQYVEQDKLIIEVVEKQGRFYA